LIDAVSVASGAGDTMLRVAARLREVGAAPVVTACFLRGCRPTFAEALEHCAACGVAEVVLQPFALVRSAALASTLPQVVAAAQQAYPRLRFLYARPLEDHPAVGQVLVQRVLEADYLDAHRFLSERSAIPRALNRWQPMHHSQLVLAEAVRPGGDAWRPLPSSHRTGLLIIAPDDTAAACQPVFRVAERIRRTQRYAAVDVCFASDCHPADAFNQMRAVGSEYVLVVPYTLQSTDPLLDLAARVVHEARFHHPSLHVLLAEHLSYDRRLVEAVAVRAAEARTFTTSATTVLGSRFAS
jgi:sirohydrochlorin ferrochelatase